MYVVPGASFLVLGPVGLVLAGPVTKHCAAIEERPEEDLRVGVTGRVAIARHTVRHVSHIRELRAKFGAFEYRLRVGTSP